jgi:hypothetical protein
MAATTLDRNTRIQAGLKRFLPAAAGVVIPVGVIAAIDASGNLVNGATSTTQRVMGVTQDRIDNTGGLAGAVGGDAHLGTFGPFANSAAGDLIGAADIGADCYVVDNQTVAKTNGGSTRVVAGKVWAVDASGVWVKFA